MLILVKHGEREKEQMVWHLVLC
ncbi:Protein CBG27858 [Caenorhabditis briggsae]|uniref:Protein CBG27858 n=1 Tax=Caenorhabditis briggsae TaxID=6238 RepID=B6IEF3_CAEBR|nr:Protein CBG27858 [Caenorhabditis briggsae]CAR98283.1 Protein CBG27858 [Caenorhabditis briggsae]